VYAQTWRDPSKDSPPATARCWHLPLAPGFQKRLQGQDGAHNEHGRRQIDQPEVTDRVEAPGIVGGERDGKREHRRRDRRDPRPPWFYSHCTREAMATAHERLPP
jgi:hypothetical protein